MTEGAKPSHERIITDADRRRVFGQGFDAYQQELGGNYERHFRTLLGLKKDEPLNVHFVRHGGPLPIRAHAAIFLSGPTSKQIEDPSIQLTPHFVTAARHINAQAARLPGDIVVYLPESHLPFSSLDPVARDQWVTDAQNRSDAVVHLGAFSPETPGPTVMLELASAGTARLGFVYLPDTENLNPIRTKLKENQVKIVNTAEAAIDNALAFVTPILKREPRQNAELNIPPDVWLSPDIRDWYQNILDTDGMELVDFQLLRVLRVGPGLPFFKIAKVTVYDPIDQVNKTEYLISRPPVKAVLAVRWNEDDPARSEVLVAKELRISAGQPGLRATTLPGGSGAGDTEDMDNMIKTAVEEFEQETGVFLSEDEKRNMKFLERLQLQEAFGHTQFTFVVNLDDATYTQLLEGLHTVVGNEEEGERVVREFVPIGTIEENLNGEYSISLQAAVTTFRARRAPNVRRSLKE